MSRYKSIHITVDASDVLDKMSDEELLDELKLRKATASLDLEDASQRLIESAHEAIIAGDYSLAQLRLEQFLFPKFKTFEECIAQYAKTPKRAKQVSA